MTVNYARNEGPAKFLVDNVALLPHGRVFDIAMGSGKDAIYLAQQGFQVEGVDISEEKVKKALDDARSVGVTITAAVIDLEKGHNIAKNSYDVIICFRYLQRSLIPAIKAGIRPGGMIVYETFIVDQAQYGKPTNPDFLLRHNELLHLFADFRCLRYHEGDMGKRRAVAGIIAQKPQTVAFV